MWGGRRVYHLQTYAGAGSKTFRKEVKYHFNIPSTQPVSASPVCLVDKPCRPCCLAYRLKAFQEDPGVFIAGVYWDMTQRLSLPSPAPASQTEDLLASFSSVCLLSVADDQDSRLLGERIWKSLDASWHVWNSCFVWFSAGWGAGGCCQLDVLWCSRSCPNSPLSCWLLIAAGCCFFPQQLEGARAALEG